MTLVSTAPAAEDAAEETTLEALSTTELAADEARLSTAPAIPPPVCRSKAYQPASQPSRHDWHAKLELTEVASAAELLSAGAEAA